MRRIRTVGLCLVALALIGSSAAATASAAEYELTGLPELGKCVPAATPKTGQYTGSHCVRPAAGKGGYNWVPGPGAKPKFEGTISTTKLETVGKKFVVECSFGVATGEYTGTKTANVKLALVGCLDEQTLQKCQNGPQEAEIETTIPAEIGYIKAGEKPKVGLDLKPTAPISFTCGLPPELPTVVSVEGSAIGLIKPPNSMRSAFKLTYTAPGGKQVPEQFEGGVKDTLTLKRITGLESATEQVGLTIIGGEEKPKPLVIENEEPIEIKAS